MEIFEYMSGTICTKKEGAGEMVLIDIGRKISG